jgi:hypothetical protein
MNITEIKLEFIHTVQEMELILAGLKKLPLEVSMDLYTKLHTGASEQIAYQSKEAPAE